MSAAKSRLPRATKRNEGGISVFQRRQEDKDEADEDVHHEKHTQTSKTILQLAEAERNLLQKFPKENSKDDISENEEEEDIMDNEPPDFHFERKSEIYYSTLDMPDLEQEAKKKGLSLSRLFLSKNVQQPKTYATFQVASTVDNKELAKPPKEKTVNEVFTVPQWSRFTIREIRVKSIDADGSNLLIQDYKKVNSSGSVPESILLEEDPAKTHRDSIRSQMSSARRVRSLSPLNSRRVKDVSSSNSTSIESPDDMRFKDIFHLLINQVKSKDWAISMKALADIAEKSKSFDTDRIGSHMTEINQRLIEFLRSPRSQVCRTACQIAGKLFESIKDTRRPEFDDIVELLLMKTADSNKFIRKDANLALDSMIMNISHFHTIRAIGQKGPKHKNDLVRISSARLYVCIVGIAGVNVILNHAGNENARQRIFMNMVTFIKDKNFKTREYGIRLYKLMKDHPNFESYLKKLIEKNQISEIKKIMKHV